jgi:hypothetical protein
MRPKCVNRSPLLRRAFASPQSMRPIFSSLSLMGFAVRVLTTQKHNRFAEGRKSYSQLQTCAHL